jgi:hypothetical protein
MAEKKDGVADGWILFKGWCQRNGGTPIRGRSSGEHICFVGPLPDDTIEPGDDGTVDIAFPGSGIPPKLWEEVLALEMRSAELRLEEAKLKHGIAIEQINRFKQKAKEYQ